MTGIFFWLLVLTILYTYAGYPVLLAVLAALRRRRTEYPPATPSITLLITAFNEEKVIAQKIENSLQFDYPRDRLQILVAVDGAGDNTHEIVREYAGRGVELSHSQTRRGKTAAINRAVPLARGEIVVFSDANNLYGEDTLRELVAPFADPTVGAVSGEKTILRGDGTLGETEGLYWKYESSIKEQETRLGCCTGVSGEALAIRRDWFEPLPENIINDDFYLAMQVIRRGYRVLYAPRARSFERVSPTSQHEIERRARIIAGRYQAIVWAHRLLPFNRPFVVWQVVSHKFMRPLVPLAMIGALVTNVVAVFWPPESVAWPVLFLAQPYNWIMLGLQAAFYIAAVVGGQLERRNARWLRWLYLPTFLLNSNWAALKGLYRFVTGKQTTRWAKAIRRESLHEHTEPDRRK